MKTRIISIFTEISNLRNVRKRQEEFNSRIEASLDRIEKKLDGELRDSHRTATAIQAAGWVARHIDLSERRNDDSYPSILEPLETKNFEVALDKLMEISPRIFPIWKQAFDNAIKYYDPKSADASNSLSTWDHPYARIFGAYLTLFARGRLLDIGSGTDMPSYLAGYPRSQIALLDPLPPRAKLPCVFARGFNEFLPWSDNSFETVISGTSLDHVLSLDKSLEEVLRILTPDGRYIVWLGSIPGSPPYNPDAPDFKPQDEFHLFHFDRNWIEPVFEKYFNFIDVSVIKNQGFDHVFYCLSPIRKRDVDRI